MRSPVIRGVGLALGALALTVTVVLSACGTRSDREPAQQKAPVSTEKGSVLNPAPELPTTAEVRK